MQRTMKNSSHTLEHSLRDRTKLSKVVTYLKTFLPADTNELLEVPDTNDGESYVAWSNNLALLGEHVEKDCLTFMESADIRRYSEDHRRVTQRHHRDNDDDGRPNKIRRLTSGTHSAYKRLQTIPPSKFPTLDINDSNDAASEGTHHYRNIYAWTRTTVVDNNDEQEE